MSTCLNPGGAHTLPARPGGDIVCSEPDCGFLIRGAQLGQWNIASLLKHGPRMDLYMATAASESVLPSQRMLVRVLRSSNASFFFRLKLLQTLYHAHIHPIFGVEEIRQSTMQCILSKFEGQGSLASFLQRNSPFSLATVAAIVQQIADALQMAHDQNIVHGHLKPENCLLINAGALQVCDFYYTFLGEEIRQAKTIFTAPEQVQGRTVVASDQFALATLAMQMVRQHLLQAQQGGDIRYGGGQYSPSGPFASSFAPLEQVLGKARRENPGERFSSIATFAQAFSEALPALPTPPPLPSRQMPSGPLQQSKPFPVPPPLPSRQMPSGPLQHTAPNTLYSANERAMNRSIPLPQAQFPRGVVQSCILPGHTATLSAMHWSPDGRLLASGSEDGAILLWAFRGGLGHLVGTLYGHSGKVLALNWSPDQSYVASASSDATIRIWKIEPDGSGSGMPEQSWEGHNRDVAALNWSPDGSMLASGGRDGTVCLWDRTGRFITKQQAHTKGVKSLVWSPDQRLIATGGVDRHIQIWDVGARRYLNGWEAHQDEIRQIEWSPNGQFLTSIARKKDTRLGIWDAHTGNQITMLNVHGGEITGVFWSQDSSWLATSSTDMTLRFWRADRLPEKNGISQLFSPVHMEGVPRLMVGSRKSNVLAVATKSFSITIFECTNR